MIAARTVLVLGAGASHAYGFPLGAELRDEVLRAGRDGILDLRLNAIGFGYSDLDDFCADLTSSGFGSVDAFLEQRQHWTGVGKAAMAMCLLDAEVRAKEKLFPPNQPRDHWYQALWSRLQAPSWTAFKKQPIDIITFNYDRSLEHYLVGVLRNNYCIKATTALAGLRILHVHGSLGRYDQHLWGRRLDYMKEYEAADSIQVVHEAEVERSEFVRARQLIAAAERVVFIGFGYLDANMRKLGLDLGRDPGSYVPAIVGTHKGLKTPAWDRIRTSYGFHPAARSSGAGTNTEMVMDWLA